MTTMYIGPETQLPWSSVRDDDRRFKRLAIYGMAALLIASIVVPWLPVEEVSREKQEALPPQLAQIILEKKELPKTPPPPPKPKVEEKKPKEKPKETPKEKPKPPAEPKQQKVDLVEKAREKAASSGLMAFQDDLADMRDSLDAGSLTNNLTRGDQTAAKVERSLIAGKASSGSGGIKTAALSQQTGGSALSSHETVKVVAPVDTGMVAKPGKSQSEQVGGRSDNAIRKVMDQNKGAIFSIYNRALRKNPSLQGKFVFEMVVEPSGQISSVKLLSSELNDDDLAKKILARIRLIRFPAEKVISTRVNYSFDFLPY